MADRGVRGQATQENNVLHRQGIDDDNEVGRQWRACSLLSNGPNYDCPAMPDLKLDCH